MCACGNKTQTANRPRTFNGCPGGNCTKYTLLMQDGSTHVFGSRLEADAANARAGYVGIVKPLGQ